MTTITLKLILLTKCLGCMANDTSELTVTQEPRGIRVSAGMPAEIVCSWKNEDTVERLRVTWKIQNLTDKEDTSKELSSKLYCTVNVTNTTALRLEAVKENDTGIYFCEINIEIPFMKQGRGNGTTLIVGQKGAQSMESYHSMEILAILPLLISGGLLYLCYKKQQNSKTSVPEKRCYEQQTLQVTELSEGNEINQTDERNSSASNSPEWAISTLYESLDYFAMKQDEDKDNNKRSVAFASNAAD